MFFQRLFGGHSKNNKHKSNAQQFRKLRVELLECREMLSINPVEIDSPLDFSFDVVSPIPITAVTSISPEVKDGILLIEGTNGADWIEIEETTMQIIVHAFAPNRADQLDQWSFTKSEIAMIEFYGFDGDDTFINAYNGVACSIACRLDGGTGNNRLIGGNGNDWIYSGTGNSTLDAGDGNNIIIGGYGNNTFYNTGTGSNCFVWVGDNNQWAEGSSNRSGGDDDALLLFTDKERWGGLSTVYLGGNYVTLRPWTMAEVFAAMDYIEFIYSYTGSYTYFQNRIQSQRYPDYGVPFCVSNGEWAALAGWNDASTIFFGAAWIATNWSMTHEVAHYWGGVSHLNPFWAEFLSISWQNHGTEKPGGISRDFIEAYARTNAVEDWCCTVAAVIEGVYPPNASDKYFQKVDVINRFFDWLNPNREARSIVVTTELDIADANDGLTSLREALRTAKPGDTITFDESMKGKTITLNGKELYVNKDITIDASGMNITIDANQKSRVFHIGTNWIDSDVRAEITMKGLTIANGQTIYDGGGIFNYGHLTLIDCTVSGSSSRWHGGGIFNAMGSTLTLTNCTFSGNIAQGDGGGICSSDATLRVTETTFLKNKALGPNGWNSGGAVRVYQGFASVSNSNFYENSATFTGGGFSIINAEIALTSVTFARNTCDEYGGGILINGALATATIDNVVFDSNHAGREGGGAFLEICTATITNTVFGNNTAAWGAALQVKYNANVTFTNTVSRNNASEWDGGGLSFVESTTRVINCYIYTCTVGTRLLKN